MYKLKNDTEITISKTTGFTLSKGHPVEINIIEKHHSDGTLVVRVHSSIMGKKYFTTFSGINNLDEILETR